MGFPLNECVKVWGTPSGVFRIWQRGDGERVEREPITGSGGRAPSGVQGQSPWSGGQGGEAPLKPKHFLLLNVPVSYTHLTLPTKRIV